MKRGHAGILMFIFAAIFVFAIIAEVRRWPGAAVTNIVGQVGLGLSIIIFFILPKQRKK